jgi:hypothetical protein
MSHDGMMEDKKMSKDLVLTGRSDLKKHVGHKVTVTGVVSHGESDMSSGRDMLAVGSLKVVGKSCS